MAGRFLSCAREDQPVRPGRERVLDKFMIAIHEALC